MRKKKPTLNSAQKAFFGPRTEKALREQPYLKNLHHRLLRIGGIAVVLWNGTNNEDVVARLLRSGRADSGRGAVLKLGEQSECHENSAKLHREAPGRYDVRTGFALSEDGIWRPHSWLWILIQTASSKPPKSA
jgi:hypothetical protein